MELSFHLFRVAFRSTLQFSDSLVRSGGPIPKVFGNVENTIFLRIGNQFEKHIVELAYLLCVISLYSKNGQIQT